MEATNSIAFENFSKKQQEEIIKAYKRYVRTKSGCKLFNTLEEFITEWIANNNLNN